MSNPNKAGFDPEMMVTTYWQVVASLAVEPSEAGREELQQSASRLRRQWKVWLLTGTRGDKTWPLTAGFRRELRGENPGAGCFASE